MDSEVLVVGGGVAGLSAAMELEEQGVHVQLVEREDDIGGRAALYSCKGTEGCSRCNLCLALDLIRRVRDCEGISLHTGAELERLEGRSGSFTASVRRDGVLLDLDVDAVILATGFSPFPAETLAWYGCGSREGVITAYDLETEIISSGRGVKGFLDGRERVAFLQCIGSRDEQTGNTYCSRICCGYALRLARLIKHEAPETEVDVFYMDLQSFGKDWNEFYDECVSEGINFLRGKATRVRTGRDGKPGVVYEDQGSGERAEHPADLVVLSVGLVPAAESVELGRRLGIGCDEYGFFGRPGGSGDGVETSIPGVFAAGTCEGPRDIAESIAHGQKAALRTTSQLGSRSACPTT